MDIYGFTESALLLENGDLKTTISLPHDAKYTKYKIGKESYMEIHIPQLENKAQKIQAQDLYYKTTKYQDAGDDIEIKSFSKTALNDIKSLEYIETVDVDGIKCDKIEITPSVETATEVSNNTNETTSQPKEYKINAYLTEDKNQIVQLDMDTEFCKGTIKYLKESKVELSKPESEFVEPSKKDYDTAMTTLLTFQTMETLDK